MPNKLFATKYMQNFQCLGGDCEDTCCQKWDIRLDKAHYNLLEKKLGQNKDEKNLFEQSLVKQSDEQASDENYAYIKLNESGFCAFLENNGLCHLHAKYGVEPLSDVCAFFPRVFSSNNGEVELTGAMSCPEVVRLCLLGSDDCFELDEFATKDLIRQNYPIARESIPGSNPYHARFAEIRETMISLANDLDYAFETRLYFLANFSYRLAAHYHIDAEANDKLTRQELARIQDDKVKQQLDDYFFKYSNTEPLAIIIIQAVLQIRIQHEGGDKLSELARQVLQNYRADYHSADELDVYGDNIPPEHLAWAFSQNWDALNAKYGAELENLLTRYLTNCLQREWFISMPDPFVYTHLLIIRIAMLRFIIASHPKIIELVQSDLSAEQSMDEFTKLIVEIVYLFARSIDHNHAFLHIVLQAIHEQQMMSFEFSMPLIKF